MKKKELPKVESVHLKPVFGLKPGIWLTILYSAILLIVLFTVLFLPGIRRGYKRVTFTSDAGNAAVYSDGLYIGGTPFTRNIESGSHNISFCIGSQEIDSFEINVSHPVFLTWVFPRHMNVHSNAKINSSAFKELSKAFLSDASSYSMILEYDSVHRYPPIFTNYASAVKGSGFESDASDILNTAVLFATTEEMQADADNAFSIIGIKKDLSEIKLLSQQEKSKSFNSCQKCGSTTLHTEFFDVNGFSDENGNNISSTCVTEAMFKEFVSHNVKYSKDNKNSLIEEGIADNYYLADMLTSVNTNKPVRNVSWYAAEAFCKWLSEISGRNVFIPSEELWASFCIGYDCKFNKLLIQEQNNMSPSGMLGSVWELTSTPYIPFYTLASSKDFDIIESYNAETEYTVKGGCYASQFVSDSFTRGSVPKDMCSDFIGFRIAWN